MSGATFVAPAESRDRSETRQGAPGSGFTFLVNGGLGLQMDDALDASELGLAGINGGIGAFLRSDLAVLARLSWTSVKYDALGGARQHSGVVGGTLQFWPSDRFNLEAGGGLGFWRAGGASDKAFGLILAANGVVFYNGGHHLQVGVEYAPAFTEGGTVHNLGFTFGYQFHR